MATSQAVQTGLKKKSCPAYPPRMPQTVAPIHASCCDARMQITHAALLMSAALFAACSGAGDDAPIESLTVIPEEVTVDAPAPITEMPAPEEVQVTVAPEDAPAPPETPAADTGPVSVALLTGDVDPASNPAFKRIPEKYLGGSRVWGHAQAVDALAAMADAAAADGVTLKAVSAFRSFRDQ
jgi:LAS superfamily LD-carboxypeptidase LdcB